MTDFARPATAAAMGDLFVPAYSPNNPQPAQDWQNRIFNVNPGNIEQTRAPVKFNTGNPGGMLDPRALQVMAQGGPYDFGARRDEIAKQVQQQQPGPSAAPGPPALQFPTGGYYDTPEGKYFMWEMEQLAKNGSPQIATPTYTESYGGGS
jgi:hypothetical protein